jgi:methionyl-tRNA formyltransferase
MRIIFMGTPEFAVPSLDILVKNNYEVVAVITAPDKPAGRGQKLVESEVKKYAVAQGLEVLQPPNLKDPDFIEQLRGFKADLQIVVAFRMLPETVWAMPPKGTFNLHGSLLPQYRGAAPINWAVINGEKETGVTTFMLKHEIDTGSIIMQDKEVIAPEDTVGTLYERLMHKGAQLVLKTVKSIETNNYQLLPQDNSKELKHAPKIFKETCQLDFQKPAIDNHNLVRGLSPYPGAYFLYQGKSYKVYKTALVANVTETKELLTDDKTFVYLRCAHGTYLSVLEIQPEGKKRMAIEDFLRGNKI